MLQRPSPSPSLELNHQNNSTYLGHLFYAEQPGELQAQHLEAELGRLVGDSRSLSPGLAQSSDMAPDASGQPVSELLH